MPVHIALIAALIKIIVVVLFILHAVPLMVWLERKVIADYQVRVGPQRVGPFGLLQSFVDGLKLVTKEEIRPHNVDGLLYLLGPMMVMIPAISIAAVIPFGPSVQIGEYTHHLAIADLPIGILFVLALTSLGVYGTVLSGWASNNKYSLLGGLRASAQMVSYELPMGLSLVAGVLIASASADSGFFSLSLRDVTLLQGGGLFTWTAFNYKFAFLGLVALITYYIGGLAETNRHPFDLAEAETELIGGYHTEYGGMRWAMFFLGEYAAMLNVSAVATVVFLGGWHPPYPSPFPPLSALAAVEGLTWFGIKIFIITLIYIALRASLPRFRYDHLMQFCWKQLLPGTLLNILAIAAILTVAYGQAPPEVLVQVKTTPGSPIQPGAAPVQPGVEGAPTLPTEEGDALESGDHDGHDHGAPPNEGEPPGGAAGPAESAPAEPAESAPAEVAPSTGEAPATSEGGH